MSTNPPAETSELPIETLEGFAGAGGLTEGMDVLGVGGAVGIEWNTDACNVARAAGHVRHQADIRALDPNDPDFADVTIWASGPPCPTFTGAGLRSGVADLDKVLAGVAALGDQRTFDPTPVPDCDDERTTLVLETFRFARDLPQLEVLIAEQVPNVRPIWGRMCEELVTYFAWQSASVITVAADDFGAPTRRTRTFLVGTKSYTPDLSALPTRARWTADRFGGVREYGPNMPVRFRRRTMAGALGWPAGVTVNTRGARKSSGGNLFSADGPAQSLTGKARTWYRTDLGSEAGRLTAAQAGLLQGFRGDYPWHAASSRTSQFQRVADCVSPPMAAGVVGAALDLPDWRDTLREYLAAVYDGPREELDVPVQGDLFACGIPA